MAEIRDILWRFLGDDRDLSRATKGAKKDLDSVEKSSGMAAAGFGRLKGAVGGFAAAYGAAEVGQFVWDTAQIGAKALEAAENLEQQLGPAAEMLRDQFDETRHVMGLTRGELDALAANYALASEGLGLTNEMQAEFVGTLIEVGGELAAYNGELENTPDFIDKVAAATRGEKDALEELIGPLSDAAIETEILRLKTDPATAALSDEAIEALALANVIRDQAEPALGSLSEAQDTSAGKAREQATRYEELREELGKQLEPILNTTLETTLEIIDAVGEFLSQPWVQTIGEWGLKLSAFITATLNPFLGIWWAINEAIDGVRNAFDGLVKRITNVKIPNPFSGIRAPSWLPGFQTGGTVPGPKGAPRLAVVHGGEQITNPRLGQSPGGGGLTVNVTAGVGDPQQIAREIIRVLQTYEQTHGALPFTTRGSV